MNAESSVPMSVSFLFSTSFPTYPSSLLAGFHHLRPNPSAAALLRSPLSSPRSALSASPRTPRGCGHRHCGRAFYHRPLGRVAAFEEMVVDLTDAAGAGSALAAHIGLEIGHTRLFRLGWGSFLPRL